jgi:hypothetical protein
VTSEEQLKKLSNQDLVKHLSFKMLDTLQLELKKVALEKSEHMGVLLMIGAAMGACSTVMATMIEEGHITKEKAKEYMLKVTDHVMRESTEPK